jgi:hypothetical protein
MDDGMITALVLVFVAFLDVAVGVLLIVPRAEPRVRLPLLGSFVMSGLLLLMFALAFAVGWIGD